MVITVEQHLRYYQSLDKAHVAKDYVDFIQLVIEMSEQSFQPYFCALGISPA